MSQGSNRDHCCVSDMTVGRPNFDSTFPISALFDPRVFARQVSASGNHPQILYHYTSEAAESG